jgi:Xaa-Pro dipeptidase
MSKLTEVGCAERRHRFVDLLGQLQLDAAIITDVRDCYYFTGTLVPDDLPVVLVADCDGRWQGVSPNEYPFTAGDLADTYDWNYRGTRNAQPVQNMLNTCRGLLLTCSGKRVGIQQQSLLSIVASELLLGTTRLIPIDDQLAFLQQSKDRDEIEVVRACVKANLAAYEAVAASIAPGVTELEVLSAGCRGSMLGVREKVFHDGDYRCGSYNGPARDRPIERGELYIVDAWTRYRGYWSDMSRTFAVGMPPTDVQQALFDHIRWIQTQLTGILRPGVDGRDVFRQVDEMIRQHPALAENGLIHHAGHCIGLRIHEMPDLNLQRGGVLQPGNVVCVEPGGYFPEARHGVRLENMYLITENGCEDLCSGEVELPVCGASST